MYEKILFESAGGVATVAPNRPGAYTADQERGVVVFFEKRAPKSTG